MAADAEKIILEFFQSPGDTCVATGAVECLHQQYPGRYITGVQGSGSELFEGNPHITEVRGEAKVIRMENPLINWCDHQPVHFLESYCNTLTHALGVQVRCTVKRPYLYLRDEEKGWTHQVEDRTGYKGRFWLVCSGVKSDYTVKGYGTANYQAVVDKLRGRVQFVQVGEKNHNHPPLSGVIDLRGQTDLRQLVRLAYHADGGLGGESLLHHMFAGLEKPFVCLASGFLPVSWVSYPTTTILTRQQAMSCCPGGKGCWKSRVVKLNDGDDKKDGSICERPVLGGEPVPKCMALISPDEVVQAILAYYDGGKLSF